jgi:hypothetical protein
LHKTEDFTMDESHDIQSATVGMMTTSCAITQPTNAAKAEDAAHSMKHDASISSAKIVNAGESDMGKKSDLEMGEGETIPRDQTRAKNVLSLTALNAAIFLAALDSTIVSTALPTIAANLNAGGAYTWVTGAYLLATAAATPIVGKLSDIWGRKPIMLTMVAMFFVSSLICALSVDVAMLIAGRVLQGVAGGGYLAMVGIITSDLFSQR